MTETLELKKKIEELEQELEEERVRRKITEDYSDCAIWEYEIATKRYVLSKKLGGKWSKSNMVIEDYQQQMHNWGFVHPDDWNIFDDFCAAMDRGDEHIRYEVRQVSDESVFVWFRYVGIPVYDKNHKPYKIMGKTMDVTEEKKGQELLTQKAERDSLTDLFHKAKMKELIENYLTQHAVEDQDAAFLIIDIDDFKSVNDSYGHLYGDEVLMKVANVLIMNSSLEDYVGRIGGDEFCIFCRENHARARAMEIAERISRSADRISLVGRKKVTLSMGIASYPKDASTYEGLYQAADQALYRVKHSGKNAFSVYDKNYNYENYTTERKREDAKERREDAGKKNIFIEREIFDYTFQVMAAEENLKEAIHKIFFELGLKFNLDYIGLLQHGEQAAEIYEEWSSRNGKIELNYYNHNWKEMQEYFQDHSFSIYKNCLQMPISIGNQVQMLAVFQNMAEDHEWTESECEILSTLTKMVESYLCRAYMQLEEKKSGKKREKEASREELDSLTGTCTKDFFGKKIEQILLWQDTQYAVAVLGIRGYEDILERDGMEMERTLLFYLGSHIRKNLKGKEMVCHLKEDEFAILIDCNQEAAMEKLNHIMITFEAMMAEKNLIQGIRLYGGIYYLSHRAYGALEIFKIMKSLKNKAKRYSTEENSIYENRKSAGNAIDKDAGILYRGNLYRLKNFIKRAVAGENLTVGFIGGSITQGCAATAPENCYAYRVYAWLQQRFPDTEFTYVNAGIGGTTSQFGAARVKEDLLRRLPDLVIVEFSVNDESSEHFMETYEGLVRQIYGSEQRPAVMLVHNVYYDSGKSAQYYHAKIGRHYGIPCISMQSSIYPEVSAGRLPAEKITADFLHPNDMGHELVAGVITHFLDKLIQNPAQEEDEARYRAPLTYNSYENCRRLQYFNSKPEFDGFEEDPTPQKDITDCFRNGWMAEKQGAFIRFTVMGTGIAVQYRRSVAGNAPKVRAVVDGDREHAVILDGAFDETWGDKLELTTLTEHMPYGSHELELEVIETHPDDAVPFYLTSVIVAGTGK